MRSRERASTSQPAWVTVSEAASILGVSPRTLRRWDTEGKLTPRRHPSNGYRLYDRAEVAEVATRAGRGQSSHSLFDERREVLERLDRARARRPRCITLFGLARVGKSTVAEAFAAERGPSVRLHVGDLDAEALRQRFLQAGSELRGSGLMVVDGADRDDVPWGELCDALPDTVDVLLVRRLPLQIHGEHTVALTPLTPSEVDAIARRASTAMPETVRALGLPELVDAELRSTRRDVRRAPEDESASSYAEVIERVRASIPPSVLAVIAASAQALDAEASNRRRLATRLGLVMSDGSPSPLASWIEGASEPHDRAHTVVLDPPSSRRWEQVDHVSGLAIWACTEPATAVHRVAHWRRMGQLRRARCELLRALSHAEESGDAESLARVWVEQGALAAATGGEEAEAVLAAAHGLLERCGRLEDACIAFGHLARVLLSKRAYDRAERTALQWFSMASTLDLRRQRDDALALLLLGSYRRRGSVEALGRYVDAMGAEEEHGAWWEALERRAQLVDVLIDRGELALATTHVARGRELAKRYDHVAFEARFVRAEAMIAVDAGRPVTLRSVPEADAIGVLEHARAQVAVALALAPARWSLAEAPFEAAAKAYAAAGDRELSVACHRFAVVARVLSGGRGESQRIGPNGRCASLAVEALRIVEHRPLPASPRRHRTWDALASHDVIARAFARLVLAVERRRGVDGPELRRESGAWRIDEGRLDLRGAPRHESALAAITSGARTVAALGAVLWPEAPRRIATARARRIAEDLVRLTEGAILLEDAEDDTAIRWSEGSASSEPPAVAQST